MEIFLIIILLLILLVSIALVAKIKLKLFLSKEGYMVVQFLFFKYTVDFYGRKVKKQKSSKTKDKEKSKPSKDGYVKKLFKQKGVVDGTVELFSVIKEIVLKISSLFSKSTVEELNFKMTVSQKDPALTAVTYGAVSTLVYSSIGILNGILPIKKQNVNLFASYEDVETQVDFYAFITVHFKNVISAGYLFIKEYIKTHIK